MGLTIFGFLSAVPGYARDGIALESGTGNHVEMARVSFNREFDQVWFADRDWVVGSYLDGSIGQWHAHNAAGDDHVINDFSITPVLRATERVRSAWAPYAEVGVGAHYISDHHIYRGRDMSTHFQFGDHVGVGFSFGEQLAWDLGLRFQHISNAGMKNPNPGINFYQVRAGYHF